MGKEIILPSRYCKNYLESIDEDTYILHSELGEYVRYGTNEDNNIYFVDPPGGPYIDVGGKLKDVGIVKSIILQKGRGFIITFDNDISS